MNKKILTTATVLLLSIHAAFAAGLRIGFMDSFATGRGNAFAATADNPSAIFYNPAGITQLDGNELSAGVWATQFSSKHTAEDGETTKMRDQFTPVPHFYYVHNLKRQPWAFGIGAYLPFGLVTEWPDDAPFRAQATRSELVYLRVNPVVSYQVNPQFSIGGGPTFNYTEVDLRRRVPNPFVPGDDVEYRLKADDSAIGFNVGARWQASPQHAFGISYHSPTRVRYEGSDEIRAFGLKGDASIDRLTFPEIVIAGYSYRPTPQWNFEANIDWTRWSRFNSTTIDSGVGPSEDVPFNWESTFFYGVGATRYFRGGHFVSAGYLYADNAVPDETFNPFLPDSRLHFFSLGFGSKGKTVSWQGGYHYAHGPTRTVREGVDESVRGRYENHVHSLSLTVAVNF